MAWVSCQRNEDKTLFWRVLKSDGELNPKFPEAVYLQKQLLEQEGFVIVKKGTKTKKYYVQDYEKYLFKFD